MLNEPPNWSADVWDRMAQFGVKSSRMAASWREIEAVRGVYDWSWIDGDVNNAVARGIEPYVLVVNTPGWARADGQPSHFGPPTEESAPYFIAFCTALAQRYLGKVTRYEIWNEENGCGWEFPPWNQYDKYLPWLRRAYQGLKAGNPNCLVAVGGLDDAEHYAHIFVNGIYSLKDPNETIFDAIADHPYGSSAEDLRSKLRELRNIMVANGDGHKPLWLTEYGWWVEQNQENWQSDILNTYLNVLQEPEFSYVTEANLLAISDFGEPTGGFGLLDVNLRPKPAAYTFQSHWGRGGIIISRVEATDVALGSVKITWTTNVASTSQVEYGPTRSYGSQTAVLTSLVTSHQVTIASLTPGQEYHFRVKSTASGKPDSVSADYTFVAASQGVLNGGFEDGFIAQIAKGWRTVGRRRIIDGARLSPSVVRSGSHSQAMWAEGSRGEYLDDTLYSRIAINPGKTYEFSCWTRVDSPATDSNNLWRRVGTDPTGGTDPAAPSVIWSSQAWSEESWLQQSVPAMSSSPIITVFLQAKTAEQASIDFKTFFDDAAVSVSQGIADVKRLPAGTSVKINGIVTASSAQFAGCLYLEEADRSCGIRVGIVGQLYAPGDVVEVTGVLGQYKGERQVIATSSRKLSNGTVPAPIQMNNAALGGASLPPYVNGVFGGIGPNNVGLLVRTAGRVRSVNTTDKYFVVDDGSVADDGTGVSGLQVGYGHVTASNPISPPAVGQYVRATGISSCFTSGPNLIRVLKPRNQGDILAL